MTINFDLPDNATNGDVIKKLYSSYIPYLLPDKSVYRIDTGSYILDFNVNWWKAPYPSPDKQS